MKPLYWHIVRAVIAGRNARRSSNDIWQSKWEALLEHIEKNLLPSGSGIDCGCEVDQDKTDDSKLIITFSYHHMDDNGYYTGWSDYRCVVRGNLMFGVSVDIYGREKSVGLKDYLGETFHHVLNEKHDFTEFLNSHRQEVEA